MTSIGLFVTIYYRVVCVIDCLKISKEYYINLMKFTKKHLHMLLKALLMIGILVGISLISLLILSAFGVVSYDDGVKLNVQADGEYIAKDVRVRVQSVDGARIVVRRLPGA